MVNVELTKVYKNNQISIPSAIRKELNITEDSIVEWSLNQDKTVVLTFKSKKPSIKDLAGLGRSKNPTNVLDLKRELYE